MLIFSPVDLLIGAHGPRSEDQRLCFQLCKYNIVFFYGWDALLIYPEGAWNITENQVVMPLFPGTAEIAIRTGAEIVPIAIEQYGKHYYANVGEAISPSGYRLAEKGRLTNCLRDALCTLKWAIWEQFPVASRAGLPEDAAEQYLAGIMSQSENGYTVEEIIRTRFHPKETSPQEAFAHLRELIPCKENAFLFRIWK